MAGMHAKITKRLVDSLDPASLSERLVVRDTELPGFQLRVSPPGRRLPHGSKSYFVYYRDRGGVERRPKLGDYPAITPDLARDKGREILARVQLGDEPRRARDDPGRPFEDVLEEFIARDQRPRVRTWREVESRLKRYVLPKWKGRGIRTIKTKDVVKLLDGVVDGGRPGAANKVKAHLSAMFNWALSREEISAPAPTAGLKNPAPTGKGERTLGDDEVRAVWRAALGLGYPFGHYVRVLLLLGQRRSEIAGLRRVECAPDLSHCTLRAVRVKNKRDHLVPIPPLARRVLREAFEFGGDYAFTTNGRGAISGFSAMKRRLDQRLQLDGCAIVAPWTLHDLRRTAATNMGRAGHNNFIVGRVLNHTDQSVTAIYNLWEYFPEKKAALEGWAELLATIVEGGGMEGESAATGLRE